MGSSSLFPSDDALILFQVLVIPDNLVGPHGFGEALHRDQAKADIFRRRAQYTQSARAALTKFERVGTGSAVAHSAK